ncbi:hypothetical protein Tco_0264308, partial [Tanacetum coccineum]
PQADKPQSSIAPSTEASDTNFYSGDILRKYGDTFPLTERKLHEEAAVHYANLKASIDDYYKENITHRDHTDKLVEATTKSALQPFNVKDHQAHALKQEEELAVWAKSSTNIAWNLGFKLSGLERA